DAIRLSKAAITTAFLAAMAFAARPAHAAFVFFDIPGIHAGESARVAEQIVCANLACTGGVASRTGHGPADDERLYRCIRRAQDSSPSGRLTARRLTGTGGGTCRHCGVPPARNRGSR